MSLESLKVSKTPTGSSAMTERETPKEVTETWEGVCIPCTELGSVKGRRKAQLQSPAPPVSSTLCVHTDVGWLVAT